MKKSLVAAISCILAQIAVSQTWQLTGSGSNDWYCVAASANGRTLVAGQYPGFLCVSTNAGSTWTTNVTMNGYWAAAASSADGTKLLAAAEYEGSGFSGIFLSTNSGSSWTSNNLPALYWSSIAMSADGKTMAAAQPYDAQLNYGGGAVFCSTNAGGNWTSNSLVSACGVAMSADGRKIFATAPEIFSYSTNYGSSWMVMTSAPPSYSFVSPSQYIASSADGNRLIYSVLPYETQGGVFISTNSGNTWSLTSAPSTNWSFVASSADAKTLMASAGGFGVGPLFVSTNSGASWTTNTSQNWASVASSADGSAMFAVAASDTNMDSGSGAIYKSQSIRPPLLNVASAGNQALLSWLVSSTNFALQQSLNLSSWTSVTNTPALNTANLKEQILVSATNKATFYRLATAPGN